MDRPEVVLVRHGATEWSVAHRHTGRSDIPLTGEGRRQAERLGEPLRDRSFGLVLSSPLARAAETARLARLPGVEERPELMEWDYGEYEGRTTVDIRRERPGWLLWRDGCPGGESAAEVAARVDPLVAELRELEADAAAVVAHGHLLRVLTARWLGLGPESGALFALSTATLSILGWEREVPVIRLWNAPPGRRG